MHWRVITVMFLVQSDGNRILAMPGNCSETTKTVLNNYYNQYMVEIHVLIKKSAWLNCNIWFSLGSCLSD
jgi:hypothetical protein